MDKYILDGKYLEMIGVKVGEALKEAGVPEKLGISKRTLQRKLTEEDTSFQKQLNGVRELLAKHYIKNTDMSMDDISFLLGYQELNSFLRAFSIWRGISVSEYKKICDQGGIV